MRPSYRVARLGDIDIEIHISMLLVLVWGMWQGWAGSANILTGLLAVGLVFLCVFIHEAGHGVQARALGLPVRRILLLPFGGMMELTRRPSLPGQELLVALGGPMANAGVAILLAALAFIAEPLTPLRLFSQIWLFGTPTISAVLRFVLFLNIALFVFNLVPAFPLDGGIAVRAGLALLMPYERATVLTSALSAVLASGIAIYGLTRIGLRGPGTVIFWLLLAAVLLWGALREASAVVRQRSLVLVRVGDVHDLVTTRLDPQTRVTGDPAAVFARQQIVGVIEAGAPRGEPAAEAMRRDFPTVHPDVTLWAAFREMRSAQLTVLPVVKNGQFLGLLTLDHIERARRYRRTN